MFKPIEARGYFIGDARGHVLGISFENGFPCGYAIDNDGLQVPIVFVVCAITDNGHDYKNTHCEVMDSAAIWADYATMEYAPEMPINPILKALYEDKDPCRFASPYQQKLLKAIEGTSEHKADLLSGFLSCHFLGRTADDVMKIPGWKFTAEIITENNETITVDTFVKCSLEDYE